MAYNKQTWEDSPSTNTPISAARLGHMEDGIEGAHNLAGAGSSAPESSSFRGTDAGPQTPWYWLSAERQPDAALASTGTSGDNLFALPLLNPSGKPIKTLRLPVTAASAAGGKIRVGIYDALSATNIYPGALVTDLGELAVDSAGNKDFAALALALAKDKLYWLAWASSLTTGPSVRALPASHVIPVLGSLAGDGAAGIRTRLFVARAYGPMPAEFPAGATWSVAASIPAFSAQHAAA